MVSDTKKNHKNIHTNFLEIFKTKRTEEVLRKAFLYLIVWVRRGSGVSPPAVRQAWVRPNHKIIKRKNDK